MFGRHLLKKTLKVCMKNRFNLKIFGSKIILKFIQLVDIYIYFINYKKIH